MGVETQIYAEDLRHGSAAAKAMARQVNTD